MATSNISCSFLQALNFWKVPLKHQLLAANAATVADSTFLCWCDYCLDAHCHLVEDRLPFRGRSWVRYQDVGEQMLMCCRARSQDNWLEAIWPSAAPADAARADVEKAGRRKTQLLAAAAAEEES